MTQLPADYACYRIVEDFMQALKYLPAADNPEHVKTSQRIDGDYPCFNQILLVAIQWDFPYNLKL